MNERITRSDSELCFLPVSILSEKLSNREISSRDLVEAFLTRIAKYNRVLHSYVEVYSEEALLTAEAADKALLAGSRLGPFHGIPIALKDLIELKGRVTTAGSVHFQERCSTVTASLAQRLVGNGLVVLGKVHTVEFAYSGWGTNSTLGTPWNPWDCSVARIPGGSSSGSAVAVAAGLAPWAIGTDTGGSVRLPASYCGLTGLKTTAGRIPTDGIVPLSQTLDTPGPLARSVADVELLYELMRGCGTFGSDPESGQATAERSKAGIRGLRLGRIPLAERNGVHKAVLAAYDESLEVLARLGAEIVEVELPFVLEDCRSPHMTIVNAEAYKNFRDVVDDESTVLDEAIRRGIRTGREISAFDYLSALGKRLELRQGMYRALSDLDALLTPTTETAAIPLDAVDKQSVPSRFTRFANTLGMCALAVPNGFTSAGLPTSLQIVCRGDEEAAALRIGRAFQEVTDWHLRRPDLAALGLS
ncbi:MAG: amidase [Rhodospirillales bacterium]|nr:amidase [Rhodospirillales bacterium]MBN9489781.1 amidase [Alphaproteobacteria bacterium]